MPKSLHDFQSGSPGFIAEWIEDDKTTDGTAAEATHAAVAGETHFICGFSVSGQNNGMGAGVKMSIALIDGDAKTMYHVEVVQDAEYVTAGRNRPGFWTVTFPAPIQCKEGVSITCKADSEASGHDVCANIWGFTSNYRTA